MQKKIAQYDSISSVVGLVENALLVSLAGQRYIRRVLGQPDSSRAIHKGTMAPPVNANNNITSNINTNNTTVIPNTNGIQQPTPPSPNSVVDFVTEADFAVQEIAEQIFFHPRYAPKCFHLKKSTNKSPPLNFSPSPTDPPPLISFIGEEYLPEDEAKKDLHHYAWFEDVLATESSKEYRDLLIHFRKACGVEVDSATTVVPANQVDRALLSQDREEERLSMLYGSSSSSPPRPVTTIGTPRPPSVQIFVDPIDGTNAMVAGKKRVPMTLIGICLSGVPVAGVINRVFAGDPNHLLNRDFVLPSSATKNSSSKMNTSDKKRSHEFLDMHQRSSSSSYTKVCPPTVSLCVEGGPCWIDGRRIIAQQSLNEEFQQKVLRSAGVNHGDEDYKLAVLAGSNGRARHDVLLHNLEPSRWFETRGAGNKLLALAKSASIIAEKQRVMKSKENLMNLEHRSSNSSKNDDDDDNKYPEEAPEEHQQQQTSESSATSTARNKKSAIRIGSDSMPDDFIFDCFVAKSQICKWDTAAPHAFLRWLNADLYRIVDSEEYTMKKRLVNEAPSFDFRPIDYSERVCTIANPEAAKFSGFDVKIEPRVIGTLNSSVTKMCAERLRANVHHHHSAQKKKSLSSSSRSSSSGSTTKQHHKKQPVAAASTSPLGHAKVLVSPAIVATMTSKL